MHLFLDFIAATPSISINLGKSLARPSESILIILALTLLAVAPAALIMLTSFPRIVVVLAFVRNALGLQTVPPNQVLAGLALFLSLLVMGPTLSKMNTVALQPYLHGKLDATQAYRAAEKPLDTWMLDQTRTGDLVMFENEAHVHPAKPSEAPMDVVIPAFILSELESAFIIGFILFVPFMIIDLVVSATLMSMGIVMLPPTLVSLPFKILLFVMVDGWALVVHALLGSFR